MDAVAGAFLLPGSQILSHPDVDAVAQTNEEGGKQGNQGGGGAYGTQSCRAGKLAHHGYVRDIEQHL